MPDEKLLLSVEISFQAELDNGNFSETLRAKFSEKEITLSPNITISIEEAGNRWLVTDSEQNKTYSIRNEADMLNIYEEQEELDDEHEKLVNDILSNDQLRQEIENRIYISGDQEMNTYIQMKQEAESRKDSWLETLKAVDRLFEPERFAMTEKKIELAIGDINRYEQKVEQLRKTKVEIIPPQLNKMKEIRQRIEKEAFDRDIMFAILVAMFPQMEWTTLELIFREIIKRMGDKLPGVDAQIANMQALNALPAMVRAPLISEQIDAIVQRLNASFNSTKVAGQTVEIVSFNPKELPEIEKIFRTEYRGLIQSYIIPTLFDLVFGAGFDDKVRKQINRWEVRQQIGYAIGGFMPQASSQVFDLLTDTWAVSDEQSIQATSGYLLSQAVENNLPERDLLSYLNKWANSGNVRLHWTAASVCKEIGQANIKLALDGLRQVLRGHRTLPGAERETVLDAVNYSLVVLSLNGFYREVILTLSRWAVEEKNPELRQLNLLFFRHILNKLLRIVHKGLQRYGREELGNQDNFESKSLEALWGIFTQHMDDDTQTAIANVLVSIIRDSADGHVVLLTQISVDLLGWWLDSFSNQENQRTYEPQVPKIIEALLLKVFSQLETTRRSSGIAGTRYLQSSDPQAVFWQLIEPWQKEERGNIKREVFDAISRSVKMEGL